MHELGHSLGLRHGGSDTTNYKPNYMSVMNYLYTGGIPVNAADEALDYSRLEIGALAERALDERQGLVAVGRTTPAELARIEYGMFCRTRSEAAPSICESTELLGRRVRISPIDFDLDGEVEQALVAADLNGDGDSSDTFPASQNDWTHLDYSAGGTIRDRYLSALTRRNDTVPDPVECFF